MRTDGAVLFHLFITRITNWAAQRKQGFLAFSSLKSLSSAGDVRGSHCSCVPWLNPGRSPAEDGTEEREIHWQERKAAVIPFNPLMLTLYRTIKDQQDSLKPCCKRTSVYFCSWNNKSDLTVKLERASKENDTFSALLYWEQKHWEVEMFEGDVYVTNDHTRVFFQDASSSSDSSSRFPHEVKTVDRLFLRFLPSLLTMLTPFSSVTRIHGKSD